MARNATEIVWGGKALDIQIVLDFISKVADLEDEISELKSQLSKLQVEKLEEVEALDRRWQERLDLETKAIKDERDHLDGQIAEIKEQLKNTLEELSKGI